MCGDSSYYNRYQFQGKAGQSIRLRLDSKAFVPYLVLLDPDGQEIAVDENAPEDDYAVIIQQLPRTGTYTILANSRQSKQTGDYTLSANTLKLWRESMLTSGNPQYRDGRWYQEFQIQVIANQEITIAAYSSSFVPYLRLVSPDGHLISETRLAASGNNRAVLQIRPPRTGSYRIQISTSKPEEQGEFSLMVQ